MAILDENEFTEVEGRSYLNPQVALDEANAFIDNLRSTQQSDNQKIQMDTYNLGTEVPSDLGGLAGANSYFTSRYQTPQTSATVSDLRAAAQATALNQVLKNEQDMWKKRYQDAYRSYQKSSNSNSDDDSVDNITTDNTTLEIGDVETEGLAKERYQKLLLEYLRAGYSTAEAEARVKQDMGLSSGVLNGTGGLERQKTIFGDHSYKYTLPNGNTVLVNEETQELIYEGGHYMLRNKETGELRLVGE